MDAIDMLFKRAERYESKLDSVLSEISRIAQSKIDWDDNIFCEYKFEDGIVLVGNDSNGNEMRSRAYELLKDCKKQKKISEHDFNNYTI